MKLPFLNQKDQWPTANDPEERVANPSYDTQIQDSLVDEIMVAHDKKDQGALWSAVKALIEHINGETNEV